MVEVVKTNVGIIPLSEHPFKELAKPKVTNEALALAFKHGFFLESDKDSPVIVLVKDSVKDKGNKYRVIIGEKVEYLEYVWEMVDPYFYYDPRNSLTDEAPRHYGEHYPPIPNWVHEFKRLVREQPMPNVLLDQLR